MMAYATNNMTSPHLQWRFEWLMCPLDGDDGRTELPDDAMTDGTMTGSVMK